MFVLFLSTTWKTLLHFIDTILSFNGFDLEKLNVAAKVITTNKAYDLL